MKPLRTSVLLCPHLDAPLPPAPPEGHEGECFPYPLAMQSHRLPGHDEVEEGVRDEQMSLRERGQQAQEWEVRERDRATGHHMSAFY